MRTRVEILGPVRLIVDGTEIHIARKQVERALVLLAALAPAPVTQDQLVEHLWGASLPADPKASLRVALSRLRTTLGDASEDLRSTSAGYSLAATTDMADFEAALKTAAGATDDHVAIDHWTRGGELWNDSLRSFAEAPLLEAIEGRLRLAREQSLPAHAECLHRLGRSEEALTVASSAQQSNLGDERLAIVCASALAATGHKVAAIELLTRTRTVLRDQLGLSPSAHFAESEDRIVRESAGLEQLNITRPAPTHSHGFVGRSTELNALLDAQPGLHVVVGEPGSGKTALVANVAEQLAARGRTVLWTKATQTPTRPMEPLAELLTIIAAASPAHEHGEALRSALSRLAPDLVDGEVSQPASRDGLLALTREAIEEFATSAHSVVVVDDAQWLDRSSADVINAMVDESDVTIIATSRQSIPANLDFLVDETRRVTVARLQPLSRSEIETLVANDLPALPLEATTDQLLKQSGGNALFLTLLAELISEGTSPQSPHAPLPPTVLVSVQQRLASLSASAQRTLEISSVFSDSFPISVVVDLAPSAEDDITQAVAQGLVVAAERPGRFRFAHALVAEAAYQLLADGSRLELHDEVGRLLEEWGAAAAEYAVHCGEAAQLDPTRAVQSHLFAAKEFAASFDWDTALLHAQRGIGYHDQYELDTSTLYAELLVLAGAAWRAQGRPEGDALLISGIELALDHDQIDTSITGLLSLCTHGRMASPLGAEIHGHLQRALSLGLTVAQRAQLLAGEAALVSISPLQEHGRQAYRRAFDMLSRITEVPARREVLVRTHLGFPHPADFAHRELATEMLSEMAGNDPDLLWEVAFLSFGTAMVRSDDDAAQQWLERMQELAPRIRVRTRDYGLRFSEAAWARYNQDLGQAEVLLAQAIEIGQETYGDTWPLAVYVAVISSIREAQGRLHELLPLVEDAMASNPDWPTWHVIAAACAASTGDAARARSELDWLKRDDFNCLSPDFSWPAMFSFLAGPVHMLGDADAAATLLRLIEPYSGLNLWNGACIHRSADEVIEIYRHVATTS